MTAGHAGYPLRASGRFEVDDSSGKGLRARPAQNGAVAFAKHWDPRRGNDDRRRATQATRHGSRTDRNPPAESTAGEKLPLLRRRHGALARGEPRGHPAQVVVGQTEPRLVREGTPFQNVRQILVVLLEERALPSELFETGPGAGSQLAVGAQPRQTTQELPTEDRVIRHRRKSYPVAARADRMKTFHVSVFARNREPLIFAHRGASGELPENTLASFREAARQGADAIEIDLQLTSDDRLVAAHDRSLRRVSGHTVVVEDTAFHVLRHLSVSRRFPAARRMVLPSIEEIFEAVGPEVALNLDLKCRRAEIRRYSDVIARSLEGRDNIVLSSFRWELLAELRRRLPACELMPAVHRRFAPALRTARLLRAPAIAAHHGFLRPGFLRAAISRGHAVLAFTVNDAGEAKRLMRRGISGFFTNFPGRLREELARGIAISVTGH